MGTRRSGLLNKTIASVEALGEPVLPGFPTVRFSIDVEGFRAQGDHNRRYVPGLCCDHNWALDDSADRTYDVDEDHSVYTCTNEGCQARCVKDPLSYQIVAYDLGVPAEDIGPIPDLNPPIRYGRTELSP